MRLHQRLRLAPACGWPRRRGAARRRARGPSTPAAAPPAPTSSTSRPAAATPALRAMSFTRPRPSVLSAMMPPPRKLSVLTAPASCSARRCSWVASCAASNLNGTVMLQPRAVPAAARNVGQRVGKAVERHQAAPVVQRLAGQFGKARMDPGRAAVLDRVAHHAVQVGGDVALAVIARWVSSVSSRVNLKRETSTIWSVWRRIASLNLPKGRLLRTMACGAAVEQGVARALARSRWRARAVVVDGDDHGQLAIELLARRLGEVLGAACPRSCGAARRT